VIKDKFGDKLDRWIQAVFPFLFVWQVNPNLLTVFGAVVCMGSAVAYGTGEFLLGALLLAAGGFFDLVDGVVARHLGRTSAFGAFLDSTLDRLVDMAVLLGLVLHYSARGELMTAIVASVGLVASVLTSYTKARAEAIEVSLPGGIIERGERIVLLGLGGLTGFMVPALWVLAVGATATVVQRFTSARRSMAGQAREQQAQTGSQEHLAQLE
jgi:phosphatidylglycerophosphate synthase